MTEKPDFSLLVRYLQSHRSVGKRRDAMCVVAAKTRLAEGLLRDISDGVTEMDDATAIVLAEFIDGEIIRYLQHAQNNGALDVVASMSGITGGVQTLHDICHKAQDAALDSLTRQLLLDVIE